MRTRSRLLAASLAAALSLTATACGDDEADTAADVGAMADATAESSVSVRDARARTALASTGVGAIYMDLVNEGEVDDELVSASVPEEIAGLVELHETVPAEDGDMTMSEGDDMATPEGDMTMSEGHGGEGMGGMTMQQVESIPVPAGGTVSLEPGGLHVMLFDLATDLEDGDTFDVVLEFAEAGSVTVPVTVTADVGAGS